MNNINRTRKGAKAQSMTNRFLRIRRLNSWRLGVFALAVVAVGCKKKEAAAGGPGGFALPVEVAVARQDTVVDALAATGQIEAIQAIELRPDIEGRIVAITVREGQEVGKGTALFKIDDQELKATLERSQADWDLACSGVEAHP